VLFKILCKHPKITILQLNNSSTHSYSQDYTAVSGQLHAMVILPPMKEDLIILSEAVWFPDQVWMVWRRKLLLATTQQFTGHTSQRLDPESITKICLKKACSNKTCLKTCSETTFVFPNKNILYLLSPWGQGEYG
jgi:hypothetical protein